MNIAFNFAIKKVLEEYSHSSIIGSHGNRWKCLLSGNHSGQDHSYFEYSGYNEKK